MTALLAGWSVADVMLIASPLAAGAAALYGRDIVNFYRARKRNQMELNMRVAALAFASLALAVILTTPMVVMAGAEKGIAAAVHLLAFGWLSGSAWRSSTRSCRS